MTTILQNSTTIEGETRPSDLAMNSEQNWQFESVDVDFASSELLSNTEFCSIMCGACSGGGCS